LERIYWAIFDSPSAKFAGVGKLTIDEHWRRVAGYLNLPLAKLPEFQRQFWNADRIDESLIDFMRVLRGHYKTGLLSNAWDNLRSVIENEWGITDAFDALIISAEASLAKPDARIYRLAVDQLAVSPHEAIFVDDVKSNVRAAAAVGLHAIHFNTRTQTLLDLKHILTDHGQTIPQEVDNGIDSLIRNTIPSQHIARQLIQLQVELEYRLDAQGRLVPLPGSTEQAYYLVHRYISGYLSYLHHEIPPTVRESLDRLGPDTAFVAPQEILDHLNGVFPCKPSGPFYCYYFPYTPASSSFPLVQQVGNRFEIWIDGQPVSWAWSVRANPRCAEIAVDTLPEFRNRGFARQVSAAWANAITSQGRTAFFSHAQSNLASQALAQSLGLVRFSTCMEFERS
jgi:HAD superfamily hydrolase (TIGR01509 family)